MFKMIRSVLDFREEGVSVVPLSITSDEGFYIEGFTDRAGKLTYREGERELKISAELLAGPTALYGLELYDLKWNLPHDKEVINKERREAIVDNIKRAYANFGYEIYADDPDTEYHGSFEEDYDLLRRHGFTIIKPPKKGKE